MVAGKVKAAMGFARSPSTPRPSSNSKNLTSSPSSRKDQIPLPPSTPSNKTFFSRSFGVYLPRTSQVQPRPPNVAELLRLIEELKERESRLRTQLLEHKILKETVSIVPFLEKEIWSKDAELNISNRRIDALESENDMLRSEVKRLRSEALESERKKNDMESATAELRRAVSERRGEVSRKFCKDAVDADRGSMSQRFQGLGEASGRWNMVKIVRKGTNKSIDNNSNQENRKVGAAESKEKKAEAEMSQQSRCNREIREFSFAYVKSRPPRVANPPPKPSSASSPRIMSNANPLPPLAPGNKLASSIGGPMLPPPPPPPPAKMPKSGPAKVRRVPEVMELYHSLMRRDSRRESNVAAPDALAAPSTRDMIGEIENRSAHLLAIKADVERQGDFICFLIKEVENAAFTDIEDVVAFVKWLDDELSFLVDERAVLKHFDWPEHKADALREAAFGYCDLKKLESEASSFCDDICLPCGPALKKMQSLLEKLEHGVYSLSRMREAVTKRYKGFQIPSEWMLDTGLVSQIKLASVKLALKYLQRVSAELEVVNTPEEEELILQGVRFAFRVHQFAGGFDMETMHAFQELRDKARLCHLQ